MAKKGMKRPDYTKKPKNDVRPVPEIQGKTKGTDGYGSYDTDLAGDNLRNDIPTADL